MRTAGQGQAAVPWERNHRRRVRRRPGRSILGRGRISYGLSQQWSAIQTPFPQPEKASGFAMGAFCEPWFFSAQKWGACVSPKSK